MTRPGPGGSRQAPARSSPRAPGPPGERCRDRGGPRSPPSLPRPAASTVFWGARSRPAAASRRARRSPCRWRSPPRCRRHCWCACASGPRPCRARRCTAEPRMRVASKPAPISTPRTAPTDRMACASSASSLSNTGSPSPAGSRWPPPPRRRRPSPPPPWPSRSARSCGGRLGVRAAGGVPLDFRGVHRAPRGLPSISRRVAQDR